MAVPWRLSGGTEEKLQEEVSQGGIRVPPPGGLDPCTFRVHVTRTAASCNLHSPHCWYKLAKLLGQSRNQGERRFFSSIKCPHPPPPVSYSLGTGCFFFAGKAAGAEDNHSPRHLVPKLRISGALPPQPYPISACSVVPCAMTQAVSRWPLTAETPVKFQDSL